MTLTLQERKAANSRLRAAHFSGKGTLFCRGCMHAPHLPAPAPSRRTDLLRLARRALGHARSRLRLR